VDWIVGAVALVLVHIIKFTPLWEARGLPTLGAWRWGFDGDLASYAIILVAAGFVAIRIKHAKLRPHRIGAFSDQCEGMLFSGQYSTLLFLIEKNMVALHALVSGRHLVTRVERFIRPKGLLERLRLDLTHTRSGNASGWWRHVERWMRPAREVIADRLPSHEEERRKAERLFARLFLSEAFVDYMARAKPYLAFDVLQIERRFLNEQFLKMYITALLRNETSVLYEEVRQNQNSSRHGGYVIDPLNPLLFHFFGDKEFRAEALYKPVGDAISAELDGLQQQPTDRYAENWPTYDETDRWACPIFVGIRLFDFLVTEGLRR
jgi:hypothetical protein